MSLKYEPASVQARSGKGWQSSARKKAAALEESESESEGGGDGTPYTLNPQPSTLNPKP